MFQQFMIYISIYFFRKLDVFFIFFLYLHFIIIVSIIMRSLSLFAPTFHKVQKMLESMHRIKSTTFNQTCKRKQLQICARAFLVANFIQRNVTEIQSSLVQKQLASIEQFLNGRDLRISYDYQRKGFQMEPRNSTPFSHPWMHLRSTAVQKMDHPIIRNTLYFHQLKDMEKYFEITYPNNAPKFVLDIYRKNAENRLLDPQNPLGLPVQAGPLLFMINFKDRFIVEFYCRYGNINIRTVRKLEEQGEGRKVKFVLSGMSIPRPIQKIVLDYCKEEVLLDEPQLIRLHRLSYIGGRVEEVEDLLRLYELFSAHIDS